MKTKFISFLVATLLVLAVPFSVMADGATVATGGNYVAHTLPSMTGADVFEKPYSSDQNTNGYFDWYGYNKTTSGTFTDPAGVIHTKLVSFSRNDDKVEVKRTNTTTQQAEYKSVAPNLYVYSKQKDTAGSYFTADESRYLRVRYYYDTTGRTDTVGEADANGQTPVSLVGKTPAISIYSYSNLANNDDLKIGSFGDIKAVDTIKENEWADMIFAFDGAKIDGFIEKTGGDCYVRQYAFYPIGVDKLPVMAKGDVFYIESMSFSKEDPRTFPDSVIYYVSENGSDENTGAADSPLLTIDKALSMAGAIEDITVVVSGEVSWPGITNIAAKPGKVTITGKDPVTGVGDNTTAVINRRSIDTQLIDCNIELSHITDATYVAYNSSKSSWDGTGTNKPLRPQNTILVVGEGYRLKSYAAKSDVTFTGDKDADLTANYGGGSQILPTKNSANNYVTVAGPSQYIALTDCATTTFSGDYSITVKGTASISETSGAHVIIGGDTYGSSVGKPTVQGKMYVTIDGSKAFKIILGGHKAATQTTLNGLQIVLNGNDSTIKRMAFAESDTGFYVNNGEEYIVRAKSLPTDASVKTTEFGKINVTVPSGHRAVVVHPDGTYEKLTETSTVSLKCSKATGNETVVHVYKISDKSAVFADGEFIGVYARNANATLPLADDIAFFADVDAAAYGTNSLTVSSAMMANGYIDLVSVPKTTISDNTVYLDPVNGSDKNSGATVDDALKSLGMACWTAVGNIPGEAAVVKIADGTVETDILTLPGVVSKFTFIGNGSENTTFQTTGQFNVSTPLEIEKLKFNIKNDHQHLNLNGYSFTAGEDVATNSKSNEGLVTVHSARQSTSATANQTVELNSGTWNIEYASHYNTAVKDFAGVVNINAKGEGTNLRVSVSDGYTSGDTIANFPVNISATITVNATDGAVISSIGGTEYINSFTGEFIVNYDVPEGKSAITVPSEYVHDVDYMYELTEDGIAVSEKAQTSLFNSADDLFWGAQVRYGTTKEDYALRFVTKLNGTPSEFVEYGNVVIPRDYLGEGVKLYRGQKDSIVVSNVATLNFRIYEAGEDFTRYTVCITDLITAEKDNSDRKYVVRPFVKYQVGGAIYFAYGNEMEYSLDDIAQAALENEAETLDADIIEILQQITANQE